MEKTRHVFVSEQGDALPRWIEAFPDARTIKRRALRKGTACDIAWLRLADSEQSVASQLSGMRAKLGSVPCIALSDLPGDEQAVAAFAAAARGYCNAHADPAVLRQVAGVVLQGGLWIGESLMQRVLAATSRALPPSAGVEDSWAAGLSEREREVAGCVAHGFSNKEIARQLGITERTVKAHVGAVLEKLKVRDRLQLALLMSGRHPT